MAIVLIVAVALPALLLVFLVAQEEPVLGAFLVLAPLLVSVPVFSELTGLSYSAAASAQKLLVIAAVALLVLRAGARRPPSAVAGFITLVLLMALVTLWMGPHLMPQVVSAVPAATVGYLYPWLVFFLADRRVRSVHWFTVLEWQPYLALAVGAGLQVAGIARLVDVDYTGTHRLTAGLFPAYLGATAMFGCAASLWRWQHGRAASFWLAGGSLGIVLLTGTRGASLVALLLFVWVLLFGRVKGSPLTFGTKAGLVAVGGLVVYLLSPVLLHRTDDQGIAQGALSGRGTAWPFFWEQMQRHPYAGNGIGANSKLGELSSAELVRDSFVAPHNTYLQLAVDFGIPVALVLLALLVAVFVHVARTTRDPVSRRLTIGLGVGLAFYAFFDNLLAAPQPAVMMPIILVALLHARSSSTSPLDRDDRLHDAAEPLEPQPRAGEIVAHVGDGQ